MVGLAVLGALIELSNSWRLRGWFGRLFWLVLLAAAAVWCVTVFLD
jgi:hypothetical protein